MTVQTLKLGRERFVVLKEKDFRKLKAKSRPVGKERPNAQDRGDIAESHRRMKQPGGKTLAEVRRRLRL